MNRVSQKAEVSVRGPRGVSNKAVSAAGPGATVQGLAKAIGREFPAWRVIVLDVDGTLTDGRIWIGPDGETQKAFHVHDGQGLKLLADAGADVFTWNSFDLYGTNQDELVVWNSFLDGKLDVAAFTAALTQITDRVYNDPSVTKVVVE